MNQTVKPELKSPEPKTLHLTLKKKWFDMIASGEKKEEYREMKLYWETRLLDPEMMSIVSLNEFKCGLGFKHFDDVEFRLGYSKNAPKIKFTLLGFRVGTPKPEWSDNWQGNVFIIKLGELKGGEKYV